MRPSFESGVPLLSVRPGFKFCLTYVTVRFPRLEDGYHNTGLAASLEGAEQFKEAKAIWNSQEP